MSIDNTSAAQLDNSLTKVAGDGKPQRRGSSQNSGWQQEMERAQFQNWFKPFDPGSSLWPANTVPSAVNPKGNRATATNNPRLSLASFLKGDEFARDSRANAQEVSDEASKEDVKAKPLVPESMGQQHSTGGGAVEQLVACQEPAQAEDIGKLESGNANSKPIPLVKGTPINAPLSDGGAVALHISQPMGYVRAPVPAPMPPVQSRAMLHGPDVAPAPKPSPPIRVAQGMAPAPAPPIQVAVAMHEPAFAPAPQSSPPVRIAQGAAPAPSLPVQAVVAMPGPEVATSPRPSPPVRIAQGATSAPALPVQAAVAMHEPAVAPALQSSPPVQIAQGAAPAPALPVQAAIAMPGPEAATSPRPSPPVRIAQGAAPAPVPVLPIQAAVAMRGPAVATPSQPSPVSITLALPDSPNTPGPEFSVEFQSVEGTHDQRTRTTSVQTLSASPSLQGLASPGSAEAPVRLHVQWQKQSANIWLGMDGSAMHVASQIEIIVAEIRRHFAALGQRVGRITCNGTVVFDAISNRPDDDASRFAQQINAQTRKRSSGQYNENSGLSPISAPAEEEQA